MKNNGHATQFDILGHLELMTLKMIKQKRTSHTHTILKNLLAYVQNLQY